MKNQGFENPKSKQNTEIALSKSKLSNLKVTSALSNDDLKQVSITEGIFEKWIQNFVSTGTRETYLGTLREFGRFLTHSSPDLGFSHPRDIKPIHVIAYRDWMTTNSQAPKTIHAKLSAVSSFFKELRFAQVIAENPVESVKRPKPEIKKQRTSFTDLEIKMLLGSFKEDNAGSIQQKLIFSLLAYTGQRISSILNLRVEDFFEKDGYLLMRLNIKGGKIRTLPLGLEPARLVRKVLATKPNQKDFLFTPKRGPKSGENKPIRPESILRTLDQKLKKLGMPGERSPHSFRRAVITKLLNTEGVSAEQVRDGVSFHESLDTLNLYKMKHDSVPADNVILTVVYPK